MFGRLLSVLTSSHKEDLGTFTELDLLSLRVPIISVFDSYRTCLAVANSDAYYDVLELYLASLLATIAKNVSEVWVPDRDMSGFIPVKNRTHVNIVTKNSGMDILSRFMRGSIPEKDHIVVNIVIKGSYP